MYSVQGSYVDFCPRRVCRTLLTWESLRRFVAVPQTRLSVFRATLPFMILIGSLTLRFPKPVPVKLLNAREPYAGDSGTAERM